MQIILKLLRILNLCFASSDLSTPRANHSMRSLICVKMVIVDELQLNSSARGMARKHHWVPREGIMTINSATFAE